MMGIRAAFELQLGKQAPLDDFVDLIWQSLKAATQSPKHPWSIGAFSTIQITQNNVDGASLAAEPQTRTVVLRRADDIERTIDCHTDFRSDKVPQISTMCASVNWMFYDASTKIQLRLVGSARVLDHDDDETDTAWQQTSQQSRAAYRSTRPPGEVISGSEVPDTQDRDALGNHERGRENFRVVRTWLTSGEWLYLRRGGHVRVGFDWDDHRRPRVNWLVP